MTEPAHIYTVVVNHEGQYSIWRSDREDLPGWLPLLYFAWQSGPVVVLGASSVL